MRVLVTGGTGYLGAHGVRALVDHGHDIRLLVRDPRRIDEVLGPLGLDPPDHAELGLTYRDVEETFRAALAGLVQTGRLSRRAAGRMADEAVAA